MSTSRIKTILVGVLIALPVLGVLFAQDAAAISVRTQEVTVERSETIDDTLFAAGDTLTIAGSVNGDIFCAGQTITISGDVTGDVICAAQTINITGEVTGDLRLAAQTIIIDSTITGSASLAAQTITLTGAGSVSRDFSGAASDLTLNGDIARHANLNGATVTINGSIGGNVSALVDSLTLGSDATVDGDVTYESPRSTIASDSEQVKGTITWSELEQSQAGHDAARAGAWSAFLYIPLAMLFFALLLVLIFPQKFQQASSFAIDDWGRTLLVGFVGSAVVPFGLAILSLTIIGIPAAIVLGIVWLLFMVAAGPLAAYLFGRAMLRRATTNAFLYMLAGSLAILILYMIPLINFFTWLAVMWFGLGMALRHIGFSKPNYVVAESTATPHKKAAKK